MPSEKYTLRVPVVTSEDTYSDYQELLRLKDEGKLIADGGPGVAFVPVSPLQYVTRIEHDDKINDDIIFEYKLEALDYHPDGTIRKVKLTTTRWDPVQARLPSSA